MGGRPKLNADPLSCPGCYSLHLYCKYLNPQHGWDEFPHEIDQFQTYGHAATFARRRGWKLHRDGTATCPQCAVALKASQHDH